MPRRRQMAGEQLRFTIEAGGAQRKLLSIAQKPTGLVIDAKPMRAYRPEPRSTAREGRVISIRTHVHPSPGSPTGNLITHHKILDNGPPNKSAYFTTAIKSGFYAPILFRRYTILDADFLDNEVNSDEIVSIGKIDTERFNLILGAFVSDRATVFPPLPPGGDANVTERPIGRYKIIVFWTFVSLPSGSHGETMAVTTTDPKFIKDPAELSLTRQFIHGFTPGGALLLFARQASFLRTQCIKLTLLEWPGMVPDRTILEQWAQFFPDGTANASEASRRHFEYIATQAQFVGRKRMER